MLLELHKPPQKQPLTSRSFSPCLPPGMKWLIPQSSVPLLCGKGEAVTTSLAVFHLEACFMHNVNQTFLDGSGLQAEY